jgi:hypothetical protein
MKNFVSFLIVSAASAFLTANAQTAGDYQSAGTVDLNAVTNWQTWNGTAWITATVEPDGNISSGNSITILPGHQWNNSSSSSIPTNAILINQGTTGTFTTSASNKVVVNGTYVHNSTSSISTILQGMTMSTGSNFIYRGSSTLTPAVSFSNRTYYNLTMESTSGSFSLNLASFAGGANPLTVNGTFTVGSNITLNQNTFTGTLNFNGDMSVSGNLNINSFSIATGKTLTIKSSGIITIPANETVTINGTVNATTGKFAGAGNLLLNGTLKSAHANGISSAGSFTNTGIISLGASSIIEFNANGSQSISSRSDYANVIINGTGNKTLSSDLSIAGNLILSAGFLVLDAYTLTIGGTASGSATSYIKTNNSGSVLMKNISAPARNIPVGNATYNPLVISNGDGLDWMVNVIDSISPSNGFTYSSRAVLRTWKITPSANPAGATIIFQYDDSDPSERATSFFTNESIQVWNFHNGIWATTSLALTPTGPETGGIRTVTLSNQSNFSDFTIANVSGPLPLTITSFSATVSNNAVQLNFINDAEYGIATYKIERVEQGRFKTITEFQPDKNDGSKTSYNYTDHPPRYTDITYRVTAMQTNGNEIYSNIIQVKAKQEEALVILLDRQLLNWRAPVLPQGKYQVCIYNLSGQLIYQHFFFHSGGDAFGIIQLKKQDVYILQIYGPQTRKRIIVPG